MRPPGQEDDGRPRDFRVVDDMLVHKRWLNPDGTYKEGQELELEQLRAELERLTKRIMEIARKLDGPA